MLGWLVFGNFADNAFDPKVALVFCTSFIGVYYIILGTWLWLNDHDITSIDEVINFTKDPIMLMYAGMHAFSMV